MSIGHTERSTILRIAFVVQRYGLEVNGGAELLTRLIAEHLSDVCDIEVITTCAIDYITWKDDYTQGEDNINGIKVYRFSVDTPHGTLPNSIILAAEFSEKPIAKKMKSNG